MKLFLDSADLVEVRNAAAMGYLDGVTTNPKLLAAAGQPLVELVPALCAVVRGPVCVPARGDTAEALVAEGRRLSELHPQVVVKVPLCPEGLPALARLRADGIHTHATLCSSPNQALLAAKCGAFFVSPFVGRLEELGGSGEELVARIIEILDNYEFETQILVASIRNPMHVELAARLGADACTLPWNVFRTLAQHPLTDSLASEYRAAGRQYS